MMEKLFNYAIIEKLEETPHSLIYRAKRDLDGETLIIKLLKTDWASPTDIARFLQEYSIIKSINLTGIIKTHDVIAHNGCIILEMEDFKGVHLKTIIQKGSINPAGFLKTAISVADTLGHLHSKKIYHGNIKPDTIIESKPSRSFDDLSQLKNSSREDTIVKLTDFGIERIITHPDGNLYDPGLITRTLAYMSPEQTGRMNCAVDYRSDMYSLGVTFYEMLTGMVPFPSEDPLEVIHSHIARQPATICDVSPHIPAMISDICMKLLAKSPEDRYQNGFGLMADLTKCREHLDSTGGIPSFSLGGKDISIKFNVPQKFIGREKELDIIMTTFDRASMGKSEMLLVAGKPGIGKTALINEIHKPIVAKRGYYISGKYDQFRRDVPYSSIIQTIQGLVRQILSEGEERLEHWRSRLLNALGTNGRIITEVIPDVELIIGKQPDIPLLSPEYSQNRFNLFFRNFIGVFASRDHPLVISLDDLQWADSASLEFIKSIILDQDIRNLLLIGAFRDNEVYSTHPLMHAVEEIHKEGVAIQTISLPPLDLDGLNQLISNFLRCNRDYSLPLAELVLVKTGGNPFFATQFLKKLHDIRIIRLDPVAGWKWDIDAINRLEVTDNIVELMAEKIAELPTETQRVVKICACIGNRFDLETLSAVYQRTLTETLSALTGAMDEGLVSTRGSDYCFHHDRIQEAAYTLISDDEKKLFHYTIGKYLLRNIPSDRIQETIIYIANQFNSAQEMISAPDERRQVANLNLLAGKKAKNSLAYKQARTYLQNGISFLPENCWEDDYDLALELHTEAAEAAYLDGDFGQMEKISSLVLFRAKTLVEKVKIYEIQIHSYIARQELLQAIKTALPVFKLLGNTLPENPKQIQIIVSLIKTKLLLSRKKNDKLIDLPEMKNPLELAARRITSAVGSATYHAYPNLLPLVVFNDIRKFLRYGIGPTSAFIFSAYGLILSGVLLDLDGGYSYGQLALKFLEKYDLKPIKARTNFVVNFLVFPWKEPIKKIIKNSFDIYQMGLENGDFEFGAMALYFYCLYSFFTGRNLNDLTPEMEAYSRSIKQLNQAAVLSWHDSFRQCALNLQHPSDQPCRLVGEAYDENEVTADPGKIIDHSEVNAVMLSKAILCYLFHEYSDAIRHLEISEKYSEGALGTQIIPVINYYDSLARLAEFPNAGRNTRRKHLKKIMKNQKLMKIWADNAEVNQLHRYHLVSAEIASVSGHDRKAMDLYEQAIVLARNNGYVHEEAIACERAAIFYMGNGFNMIAAKYINEAHRCYHQWGAMAKVEQIKKKYPQYFNPIAQSGGSLSMPGVTGQTLDLMTVMKASQIMSGEIYLDRLLEKMLRIAMENAGAERGALILEKDGRLYIEAEGSLNREIEVLKSIPVEKGETLSEAIVYYVNNTGNTVVLDNASNAGMFTTDPHIIDSKAKSVLCAPIRDKGKTAGIIYLENNLAANVFKPDRIEMLSLLSAQAVISIENARLLAVEKEKAAMDRDIHMAKNIQDSLLPTKLPELDNARLAFKYAPMTGIGGDFISVKFDEKTNLLGLFICDVSGHGVHAALTASMIGMALDTSWKYNLDKPAQVLRDIRNQLIGKMAGNFFTACICILDLVKGVVSMASGGHPDVILIKADGNSKMIRTPGRLINDFFEPNWKETSLQLSAGDRLILYTDGITEARNPAGIMLGEQDDSFLEWMCTAAAQASTPEDLCTEVYRAAAEHTGRDVFDDDFTILVLEMKE